MGRAMLIIAAGAIIAVGILQVGVQSKRTAIAQNSAVDAYEVEIRNKAFTAAQLTMERINASGGTWHPKANNPWEQEIDGTPISLYYNLYPTSATGNFAMLEGDTVEIHATARYLDPISDQEREINIITNYVKTSMHFVPEFKAAMQFAVDADDFTFSAGGSSLISGNDASGTCAPKNAIAVRDEDSAENITGSSFIDKLLGGDHSGQLESDTTAIGIDPDLSYKPVDQLVARLAQLSSVTKVSGNYKGSFGSKAEPGIFFVEDKAKLTGGIDEGFGIMVVRSGGELEYEGELSVAGNFKFNGLVIFENAYNMTGRGTPRINGSVLVGKAEDTNERLNVDLGGTIDIQYDCVAEKYAQLAAAMSLDQNRYKRLSTYE